MTDLFIVVACSAVILPCTWCTWKIVNYAHELLFPSLPSFGSRFNVNSMPVSQNSINLDSSSQSLKVNRKIRPQWAVLWTVFSSCCFTMGTGLNIIRRSIRFHRIHGDYQNEDKKKRTNTDLQPIFVLYMILVFFAYDFLMIACFERLVLTFKRSQYRLSHQSILMGRCAACAVFLFPLVGLIVWQTHPNVDAGQRIGVYITVPAMIIYPSMLIGTTYQFMTTTEIVAQKMIGMRQSMSVRKESVDESAMQRTTDLLDASLRLSVVSVVSASSTICMIIIGVIGILSGERITNLIGNLNVPIDSLLNTVSLMFTFQKSSTLYHTIFGRLHQWLLGKLTERVINPT